MINKITIFLFSLTYMCYASTQLGSHFSLTFAQKTCDIQIIEKATNTTIFASDAYLISSGFGDVDSVEIMEDGNVINFPRPYNETAQMICEDMSSTDTVVTITGQLVVDKQAVLSFSVVFSEIDSNRVGFHVSVPQAYSSYGTNYLSMTYASPPQEEIYGMGLQYTEWNFKGHKIPLIVDEGGVGRGRQPITWWENRHGGQGGSPVTSYGTTPNYITNLNRGIIFNTTFIGIADFEDDETASFLFWHATTLSGVILYGESPLNLAQLSAQTVGLMTKLPDWVHTGAVVGIVGGQKFVDDTYAQLKSAQVPIAGIWMQDWVGEHKFPEGTRLLWNWALNRNWYPEWDRMVSDWAEDDVKPLVYFNPYIANLTDVPGIAQNLFQEGVDGDYFVKNSTGGVYLIQSISIHFAIVDFTNPGACKWFGDVLVNNGVKDAKSSGWMHDFGEYLPFDAVLYDGSDPKEYHNRYPEAWAKLAYDYLADYPDVVYFMRSASTASPRYTRLFWMGDQLMTYGRYDGMHSAMVGLLNSGLSGFTMGHSDIGGYTSLTVDIMGVPVLSYMRDKTMLQRWIEMSTFSDTIMRSHPSNNPTGNYQIWDDPETTQFFANFTRIHVALGDYKASLVEEATTLGTPVTRPLLLHFPDDVTARAEHSQFMLGPNVLMAPMFDGTWSRRSVYLPGPANWTYLWTGEEYQVGAEGRSIWWFSAPLGRPAVFLRSTEEYPFNIADFVVKVHKIFGLIQIQIKLND